jgi:hypothetical protein
MQNNEVALHEYRGLSDELMKNISGPNGRWWLNRFKNFLRKENPWDVRLWETWRTVAYGEIATPKWLKDACSRDGKEMCGEAYHVLKHLQTTKERSDVELIIAPMSMLGIEGWYSIEKANLRIKALGFDLLTPEMVFNLHRYGNQVKEFPYIAMEPISIKGGRPFVFCLTKPNDYARNLTAFYNPTTNLMANHQIVFAKKSVSGT